jgi:GH24 family phage-related lysozyme (muramidase)
MQLSDAGADFIGKGYENPAEKGFNAKLNLYFQYDDGYGTQTIGYGHAVKDGEDFSKGISPDQVRSMFKADSAEAVGAVNGMTCRTGMTQNQFDALVSLQFNAGPHAYTPPLRDFNATGSAKKSDFTGHYTTSGGVPSRGLAIRRAAEWRIFSTGVYDASH